MQITGLQKQSLGAWADKLKPEWLTFLYVLLNLSKTSYNSISTSYWVFTHLYIHLAAPWRRMPVVLKEDLGLSSLGLTGSRGILQYGVAFMKIISRRSNDRLFDNPIRGETSMTFNFSESIQRPSQGRFHIFPIGRFQLEFVSISWVINHMCSHWLKLQVSPFLVQNIMVVQSAPVRMDLTLLGPFAQ